METGSFSLIKWLFLSTAFAFFKKIHFKSSGKIAQRKNSLGISWKLILRWHRVMFSQSFRSVAVLHFGRFTSAVGAALAVIELSALSKSSASLLKTSGGLHSSPAEAPLPQFCLGGRAIKLYSAALERLTINAFTKKKKEKILRAPPTPSQWFYCSFVHFAFFSALEMLPHVWKSMKWLHVRSIFLRVLVVCPVWYEVQGKAPAVIIKALGWCLEQTTGFFW